MPEIRRVPAGWEHPTDDHGQYKPMTKEFYGDALQEWLHEHSLWEAGTHPDLAADPDLKLEYPLYAMYCGNAPDPEYYMTKKYSEEELTHIQLYETCTEGTPISPVFRADQFEQLCEYAEKNCHTFAYNTATKEEWMKMLSDGVVYHREGNAVFL